MALEHAQRRRPKTQSFARELGELRREAAATSAASTSARQPLQSHAGQRLRVHAAAATWMAGIFAVVYVAGPIALAMFGLYGAISSVFFNAFAFMITVPLILLALELRRPAMNLDRSVDPVLPFAAGSFVSWALLHNSMPLLRPFADFGTGELAAFLMLNGLEFTLFAMFFATLVRSRVMAFALGFSFQVGYILAFLLGASMVL